MSSLKLYGSTSGYVEIVPEATAGNNSVTLPNTAGSIAVKDASGNLEVGTGVTVAAPSSNTFTVSTNGSERIRIDSSGRFGLGTNNPVARLHISTSANGTTTGSNILASLRSEASGRDQCIQFADGATSAYVGMLGGAIYFADAGSTERARIDTSGRLLVGTTAARSNVNIGGGSGYTPFAQINTAVNSYSNGLTMLNYSANGYGPALSLGTSKSNTSGTNTILGNGDDCGRICFNGNDGTNFLVAAQIAAFVDGTPGANDMPGNLVFSTTADGASSPTERMTINSNGFVNIGAYTIPSSTPGIQIYGAGNLIFCKRSDTGEAISFFANSTTKVGNIVLGASSTTYNTSSDYRLKENVVPLTGAADRLNQLQVHRFNFIVEPDKTVDGFLAHEAQAVVPECVTGTKDEVDADGNPIYQGIDQSKLVPLLTAALQEALAKIETLEAKVAVLEGN